MKLTKLAIIFSLFISSFSFAQDKYFTRAGHISFHSETPVETILANNNQVTSLLDITTGEMVFAVLIKGFEFEKALMQEHFNENYMESDKFPKAKFSGKILNLSKIDFKKDGKYDVDVEGDLEIHGVTKKVTTKGTIEKKGNNIIANTSFQLKVADYNIQIPNVVKGKIAETVDVKVDLNYEPKTK